MKDYKKVAITDLKISYSKDEKLSKTQQTFNELTEQLALLEADLEAFTKKMDSLSSEYEKKILPLKIENAKLQIETAKQIAQNALEPKYGHKNMEKAGEVIQDLLSEAFEFITPDEETQKLYDSWAEQSYQEEVEQMNMETKEMTEAYLKDLFGLDIDLSEFDASQEGQARMHAHIKSQMEEAKQRMESELGKAKGKSKKQRSKEQAQRDAEALELKSLRSVYITLAKALHPDTETDLEKKQVKNELMKKIVVAYENKDLAELLKLEMKWIPREAGGTEKFSEDKLSIYNNFLKKKVQEIRDAKRQLAYHPRYQMVSFLAGDTEKKAKKALQEAVNFQTSRGKELAKFYRYLKEDNSKKTTTKLVDLYLESMDLYI